MKKTISLILVLTLLLSMAPVVFAEGAPTVYLSADKTTVNPDDVVAVSVNLSESAFLSGMQYAVRYNTDEFEPVTSSRGNLDYSKQKNGATYNASVYDNGDGTAEIRMVIFVMSDNDEDFAFSSGMVTTFKFVAKNVAASNAAFSLVNLKVDDQDMNRIIDEKTNGTVTVPVNGTPSTDPEPETPASPYTITMGTVNPVAVGEIVEVPVTIGSTDAGVTTYNAYDMIFGFNSSMLDLNMEAQNSEGYKLIPGDGTVQILRYGTAANLSDPIKLSFKTKAVGTSNVTVTNAKVDIAANSISFDAPDAAITVGSTSVTATGFTVEMPDDFKTSDPLVVDPNGSFTFTPKDPYYNYTVSATVGGVAVQPVLNDDGSYTISGINGNVVITSTKTAKTFSVMISGEDVTGAETATYMTDYTFTVDKETGYIYEVSVTIGGEAYSPTTDDNVNYTIKGEDIKDNIAVTVTKQLIPPTTYAVEFAGNGAEDVVDPVKTVTDGANYTFSIDKKDNYTYTVTAKMGGTDKEVVVTADGYKIENVTGDLVITIVKEAERELVVEVSNYVEADGKTVFLVTVKGAADTGKTFAYDGNKMYKTTAYGDDVYSYLVFSGAQESLTADDAKANITQIDGEDEVLTQTFDVNETGLVDINDAQLAYNMYKGKYSDFSEVSVRKFLKADANSDGKLNSADAVAIVAEAN